MKNKLMGILKDDAGQAMTEYGLIIALVAVVVIVALGAIGTNLNTKFLGIGTELAK
ncbi:Flp family type IVb pilin [Desulfitobacterium metallireducens]|uniref:Flp/Fap pilin protein n=1 Tax=Desulfitobacterium metallireducens DSM 15288 TaxID=871968 RepID=W0ECD2_9FIRM|nr:Flp family type IVb pilin [Desulfitobacterium metallireducens]AHF06869.1 Flp/Fap pilin protein [Desulfitobacterium metallireducens DSM 15288]